MGCGLVKDRKKNSDRSPYTSLNNAPRDFTPKVNKGTKHINWCSIENGMIDPMSLSFIKP